jgi:hypothetical protein
MLTDEEFETQGDDAEETDFELPEFYQGKSLEDVIKLHQDANTMIGKQAQEVGEVRKLADELLKQNLSSKQAAKPEPEPEVDFFEDPRKAVQSTIGNHPDVVAAKQASQEFRLMQVQQRLSKEHPDFADIVEGQDFQNWVKSSPIRTRLYALADGSFDYDSANELLTTYKELRDVKSQQSEKTATATRTKSMKAAQVDVGGSGESSRKVYRRADLIRLKMTDPSRYEMLSDEILAAYAEGRVK